MLGLSPADVATWATAIDAFEHVYMAGRNFTENTRINYRIDIEQLAEYFQSRGLHEPTSVSLSMLQNYLAYLDGQGYAGVSRARKVSTIKTFFEFLKAVGAIDTNPAEMLIPPEKEHTEPRYLTEIEYKALMLACSYYSRDAAIIELVLQTGIRLSEVVRLALHDVHLPSRITRDPENVGLLKVRGKGRKERTLPLNYKVCRALRQWLKSRPSVDTSALFVTKFGKAIGQRAVQNVVAKYLDEAGVKGASVHTLRHSFATHHVAKGTDLRTIQEAMGHSNLKTTSVYVSLAKTEMNKAMQVNAL